MNEKLTALAVVAASMGAAHGAVEHAEAHGRYTVTCHEAKPGHEVEYVDLTAQYTKKLDALQSLAAIDALAIPQSVKDEVDALLARLELVRQVKWVEDIPNVVTTVGKNYLLDNGLAGSAYTAAFFLGLISSVSYSAVAAGDTMASHAGWLEAGATNAPTYSGARKTAVWAAASAGSKALSAGLVFTFTGAGTVKGCFMNTVSTVDGTTGTLYSAGLFTGGDQPVVSTNTLTVSYTASL